MIALLPCPARVSSDEAFVDAFLRLIAQVVVNARDDNDEAISRIGRLADQPGVVGRLPALNMTHDHAAPVPTLLEPGVAEPAENAVGDRVRAGDDILREAILQKQLLVSLPVVGRDRSLCIVQPWNEVGVVDHGAKAHGDAEPAFDVLRQRLERGTIGADPEQRVEAGDHLAKFLAGLSLMREGL